MSLDVSGKLGEAQPDNAVRAFVGVEGTNDINFLKGISRVLSHFEEDIPNLEVAEVSGHLVSTPQGGSNLENWIGRLTNLNRPEFHLFDRDTAPPNPPKYEQAANRINALPGCFAGHTDKREVENYIHHHAISQQWPELNWQAQHEHLDVPLALCQALIASQGKDWGAIGDKGRRDAELGVKVGMNRDVVLLMTPEMLTETDPQSTVRGFLRRVGQALAAQ